MSIKTASFQAGIVFSGLVISAVAAFAVGASAEKPEPVELRKDLPACEVTDKINRQPCEAVKPQ